MRKVCSKRYVSYPYNKKNENKRRRKLKLIEEYKDYKTPQIKSCFEPICVAMKPLEKR